MTRIAFILSFLLGAGVAFAQAPAPSATDAPKHKCEPKPEYPGRLALTRESGRKLYERDIKTYKDCMMAYLEARKASMKSNEEAANAAINEYNDVMKKLNEAQAAADK